MNSESDSSWIEELRTLAEERWSRSGSVLLLSQAPQPLKARGINLSEVLRGRKLRHAIEIEGRDLIWLIADPDNPLVWGVVHNSELAEADPESLFQNQRTNESTTPKFHKAFWAAFIKPIRSGCSRYVAVEGPIRFSDILEGESPAFDGKEIAAKYIVSSDKIGENFDAAVFGSIQEWSEQNQISLERFYWKSPSEFYASRHARKDTKWLTHLSKLSSKDLARISVPLDIVATLLDEKGAPDK